MTNSQTNNPFIDLVQNVIEPNSRYNETEDLFTIQDITKRSRFKIFNYNGSLTTPDCNEVVTWLVAIHPIPINSEDLDELRRILDEDRNPLEMNFRPIQDTNNRQITLIRP